MRTHKARIGEALGELETNPLAGHVRKGRLTGLRSLSFTVKGSGAFRAIYAVINDEVVCLASLDVVWLGAEYGDG